MPSNDALLPSWAWAGSASMIGPPLPGPPVGKGISHHTPSSVVAVVRMRRTQDTRTPPRATSAYHRRRCLPMPAETDTCRAPPGLRRRVLRLIAGRRPTPHGGCPGLGWRARRAGHHPRLWRWTRGPDGCRRGRCAGGRRSESSGSSHSPWSTVSSPIEVFRTCGSPARCMNARR